MKKLLLSPLFFLSLNLYANGCPGQFDPQSGICRFQGNNGELVQYNAAPPQSGYSNQNTPPKKTIRHITMNVPSKYGALAFNKKTGISGGAINADSLQQAKKLAVQRCENGGTNAPCKVIAWVRNGCIAGAVNSHKQLFKASSEIAGRAEQLALNRCQESGGNNCKIAIPEGCSIP